MPLLKAAFTALLYLQTAIRCNLIFIPYSMFFTSCKNSDQKPSYHNLKLQCKNAFLLILNCIYYMVALLYHAVQHFVGIYNLCF